MGSPSPQTIINPLAPADQQSTNAFHENTPILLTIGLLRKQFWGINGIAFSCNDQVKTTYKPFAPCPCLRRRRSLQQRGYLHSLVRCLTDKEGDYYYDHRLGQFPPWLSVPRGPGPPSEHQTNSTNHQNI